MPFGARLAAAQEVALGHNPDDLAAFVQYRQPADVVVEHQPDGLRHRCSPSGRHHVAGHDVRGLHLSAPRAASPRAATPGSSRPSSHSRKAPPAVET